MNLNRNVMATLVAGCVVALSGPVFAQTAKPKVDARAMAPGLQSASEPAAAPPAASGLTRNQRQEAALQARQEGNLAPAGEAIDPRGERASAPPVRRVALSTPPLPPAPSAVVAPSAESTSLPPTTVATTAAPAPAKKKARRPSDTSAGADQHIAARAPVAKPARAARPGKGASDAA